SRYKSILRTDEGLAQFERNGLWYRGYLRTGDSPGCDSPDSLTMNKKDIAELIDEYCKDIPERMSGNESNPIITARLENLVRTERAALVDLLRDWIAIRIPQSQRKPGDGKKEGRLW